MTKNLPPVFVLNHVGEQTGRDKQFNLSTLAVVRSLGRRGIPVILVTTNERDGVAASRFVSSVRYGPYFHDGEQELLEFLLSLGKEFPGKKVLLPTVDESSYFTGKYHEQLCDAFLVPAPNWDAISRINNKRYQYEAADSLGIPIPETYFPETVEDVADLAGRVDNFPYVIKPNVSFEWKLKSARSSTRGKKGIRVSDAEELVARAKEVFVPGHEFMVQEVIGGRDERLVSFLGYFTESFEPHSFFIRRKIRQCPVDFGYCTMTESYHDSTVQSQSTALLKEMKYHGIAGVEWKLDPSTNTYKLIEINARPVNTTGCAVACGVDLPAIAYFDAIGETPDPVTDWQDGLKWAWLNQDFGAAKQLKAEGKITWRQWLKSVSEVEADAVFARDDAALSLRYYARFLLARLGRLFSGKK